MKHLSFVIHLSAGLLLLGCGAERTVEVTFHDEAMPSAPPVVVVPPRAPAAPVVPVLVIPEAIHIEAQLSDVYVRAKPVYTEKFRTEARFTLSLAQFSGGFPHGLDLSTAERFRFRSKYDKGCDKSGFRFSAIAPNEPSSNQFVVVEPRFDADCNQLFGNIRKDMRVEFFNVPVVNDRSKIVPFVSLHMIP